MISYLKSTILRPSLFLSSTTAYQKALSSAAFAEAQSQAKRFESEAYDKAASKVFTADYFKCSSLV